MNKTFFAKIQLLGFALLLSFSVSAADVKEWNILIFSNGKNNLEADIHDQLVKLEQGQGSTKAVNILVEFGSLERREVVRYKLIRQPKGSSSIQSPILENLGNEDLGDWKSFVRFIEWSKKFPAKRTMVIIADHGMLYAGTRSPIMSYDEVSGNGFNAHQVTLMLTKSAQILGRPIDVLLYDLCLLSSLELQGQSYGAVQYYIASREVIPGQGVNYLSLLNKVIRGGTKDAREIAYIATRDAKFNTDHEKIYFSALNMKALPEFSREMKTLIDLALALPVQQRNHLKRVMTTKPFRPVDEADSGYVDVRDVLNRIDSARIPALAPQIVRTRTALYRFMFDPAESERGGLSVYFSHAMLDSPTMAKQYSLLRFERATGWSRLIRWLGQ